MEYTCVIIDDEVGARSTIRTLVNEFCPQLTIVAECASIEESIPVIHQTQPDLLFLDLKLGDGLGFEIIDFFENPQFEVILITAFDDQRKNAMNRFCLQYLTKPIDLEMFIGSYKRFLEIRNGRNDINATKRKSGIRKITIPTRIGYDVLNTSTIVHIESDGNYSKIHSINDTILTSKTLKYYDDLLSTSGFFRIHRSHLINLNFVKSVNFDGTVVLESDIVLPVSSSGRKDLIAAVARM